VHRLPPNPSLNAVIPMRAFAPAEGPPVSLFRQAAQSPFAACGLA
jgi:hypothetical protein